MNKPGNLPQILHLYHLTHLEMPLLEIRFVRFKQIGQGRVFTPEEFGEVLIYTNLSEPPKWRPIRPVTVEGLQGLAKWLKRHGYSSNQEDEVIVYLLECWAETVRKHKERNGTQNWCGKG